VAEPLAQSGAAAGTPPPGDVGPIRTVLVALAVCGVCALVLTGSVVLLRPYQLENQRGSSEARVHELVASLPGVSELVAEIGGAELELRTVELRTGHLAPSVDAMTLLDRSDASEGRLLPPDRDPAGVGRVPRYAPIYFLRRNGALHTVILPVSGRGYGGTLRGHLALAGDGETVRGINFDEHRETPGVGAEIENPHWQALWRGKRLHDATGALRIRTVERAPAQGSPEAAYEVQGISGATRTSRGVTELLRFWVGPDGFGPFLARLRAGENA